RGHAVRSRAQVTVREELPDGSLRVTNKLGKTYVIGAEQRRKAADRFRNLARSRKGKSRSGGVPKGRKDLSTGLTMLYGMVGGGLEVRGVNIRRATEDGTAEEIVWQPSLAGRVMKVQSPMVGKVLSDDLLGRAVLGG